MTEEEKEIKRKKAFDYFHRISEKIKQAFTEIFQEISQEPEPDFHLMNMAFVAVFTTMAACVAVDELLSEEQLMEAVRAAHKDALATAPKFG